MPASSDSSYRFANAPVDIFAEIAPAIDVAPSVRG